MKLLSSILLLSFASNAASKSVCELFCETFRSPDDVDECKRVACKSNSGLQKRKTHLRGPTNLSSLLVTEAEETDDKEETGLETVNEKKTPMDNEMDISFFAYP